MPIEQALPFLAEKVNQTKQNLINFGSTLFFNNQQKKFIQSQYDQQRRDSLADWNMMNQYNSPAEQMKRFKEAGLNPRLIYGQMNEGATVRSTPMQSYNPQIPDLKFNAGNNAMQQFQDIKLKDVQTDNIQAQTDATRQRMALEAVAQAINNRLNIAREKKLGVDTSSAEFELEQSKKLAPFVLEKAGLQNKLLGEQIGNTLEKTNYMQHEDARQDKRLALEVRKGNMTIAQGVEQILRSRQARAKDQAEIKRLEQAIEINKKQNEGLSLDLIIKRAGLHWGDDVEFRAMAILADQAEKKAQGEDAQRRVRQGAGSIKKIGRSK